LRSTARLRFVAVEITEEAGGKAGEPPRRISARGGLDLDDIGAEIGKDEAGGRPHDVLGEFEDVQPRQWQQQRRGGFGHASHASANPRLAVGTSLQFAKLRLSWTRSFFAWRASLRIEPRPLKRARCSSIAFSVLVDTLNVPLSDLPK